MREDWMLELRYSMMSPRRSHVILSADRERLPEPLQPSARAMDEARTDDEARAAAQEFLLLSEEYLP